MSLVRVGVVGAGIMGNGIAQVRASAGLTVSLLDIIDARCSSQTNAEVD